MIPSKDVRSFLERYILADGMDIIIDLAASQGSWLVDRRSGDQYLDFFSMFASMAVGFNHPRLVAARDILGALATQKPANSDIYSEEMAEFVETFAKFAMPPSLPHAFFIEGGALAVENALKTAFDWKVRKNMARGIRGERGSMIMHFRQAFHGRSGYTLSLTNTADPRKTSFFPRFDWPRIVNPKLSFPITKERLIAVKRFEDQAMQQMREAVIHHKDDIAGLIIEPIQGEGGDNHFRAEFLQGLRQFCDTNEILFILDEIQTGLGLTGKFWAHEHFGVEPDILCFGKKTQVCGILASRRIDEVAHGVFAESSRINSTFGGNLIDMVRCTHILDIITAEKLIENANIQGKLLLEELSNICNDFPDLASNPRGRGLMCAFDLPNQERRDRLIQEAFSHKLLILGCGTRSIRFRPHLIVKPEEIEQAMAIIRTILSLY